MKPKDSEDVVIIVRATYIQAQPVYKCQSTYIQVRPMYKCSLYTKATYMQVRNIYKCDLWSGLNGIEAVIKN